MQKKEKGFGFSRYYRCYQLSLGLAPAVVVGDISIFKGYFCFNWAIKVRLQIRLQHIHSWMLKGFKLLLLFTSPTHLCTWNVRNYSLQLIVLHSVSLFLNCRVCSGESQSLYSFFTKTMTSESSGNWNWDVMLTCSQQQIQNASKTRIMC